MGVRVALVGAGGIAGSHVAALKTDERVEIAAVCDVVREQAEKTAADAGAAAYSDFDAMLRDERPDALFVCVPPFAHGEIEEKAAERGIHLFVEKPLGLDMETVRIKAEAIAKAGIVTGTGYSLRYLHTVAKAKRYLEGKKVALVRAYLLCGFVRTPWWREMSKSGGQLVEQTTHMVDLVRYLAGDIRKVYADMALRTMHDIEGLDIPDVGSVNMVLASGAIAHVATCFNQPDYRNCVEVMGRDFRLSLKLGELSIVESGQTTTYTHTGDSQREQDRAFIDAVVTGDRSRILAPYEEALKTLQVTLAANESAGSGLPVQIG